VRDDDHVVPGFELRQDCFANHGHVILNANKAAIDVRLG
jgi:hypothetical protein